VYYVTSLPVFTEIDGWQVACSIDSYRRALSRYANVCPAGCCFRNTAAASTLREPQSVSKAVRCALACWQQQDWAQGSGLVAHPPRGLNWREASGVRQKVPRTAGSGSDRGPDALFATQSGTPPESVGSQRRPPHGVSLTPLTRHCCKISLGCIGKARACREFM